MKKKSALFAVMLTIGLSQPVLANDNPLGGLFKGLKKLEQDLSNGLGTNTGSSNQSNGSSVSGSSGGTVKKMSSSQSSEDIAGSKYIASKCFVENPAKLYAKLPGTNVGKVVNDFNMGEKELMNLLSSGKTSSLPYIYDLEVYNNAFASRNIAVVFEDFNKTVEPKKRLELLGLIAASMEVGGFSKDKKAIGADATAAYGLIHLYYSNYGGNKDLGHKLIKAAAKKKQVIAPYIEGLRYFKGYGYAQNLTSAAQWMRMSKKALFDKNQEAIKSTATKKFDVSSVLRDKVNQEWFALIFDPAYPNRDEAIRQQQLAADMEAEFNQKYNQDPPSTGNRFQFLKEMAIKTAQIQVDALELLGDAKGADQTRRLLAKFQADKNIDKEKLETFMFTIGESDKLIRQALGNAKNLDSAGKEKLKQVIYDLEDLIYTSENYIAGMFASMLMGGGGIHSSLGFEMGTLGNVRRLGCSAWANANKFAKRTSVAMKTNRQPKTVKSAAAALGDDD